MTQHKRPDSGEQDLETQFQRLLPTILRGSFSGAPTAWEDRAAAVLDIERYLEHAVRPGYLKSLLGWKALLLETSNRYDDALRAYREADRVGGGSELVDLNLATGLIRTLIATGEQVQAAIAAGRAVVRFSLKEERILILRLLLATTGGSPPAPGDATQVAAAAAEVFRLRGTTTTEDASVESVCEHVGAVMSDFASGVEMAEASASRSNLGRVLRGLTKSDLPPFLKDHVERVRRIHREVDDHRVASKALGHGAFYR